MVGVGEVGGRELGWGAEIWPQGDNLGSRLKEAEVPFICTHRHKRPFVRLSILCEHDLLGEVE